MPAHGTVSRLIPLYATRAGVPDAVGVVHHQRAHDHEATTIFVEVTYAGLTMIVPARRLNRITDPHHVYILADGSLWMSAPREDVPVFAEVLGANREPYQPKRKED